MAAIGTRKLTLELDGEELAPEVSSARIVSGETESDFVSFADANAGGGRDYVLALTLVQDLAADSTYRKIWEAAGTDVAFTLRPYGNASASAGEPHITGTCTIREPDGDLLGGEANPSSTAKFTVEVEWPCLAKPTIDTGA